MAKSLDERFKERNFLPALKPRMWQARKAVFCRRLVDNEHETVPLVAYGWDSSDRTEFVTREAIAEAGASKSRAHKYALRNLARRAKKVKWSKQRYPMGRKKVSVAMVEGDEFTGSFVLVPEFLEAAHDLLDCETLVIGIPNRFSLWACDAALAPLMVSFAEAQFEEAEEDEREPVTPALILSLNGKLAGIVLDGETAGPPKRRSSKTKERPSKTKERPSKTKERSSKTKERSSKTKEEKRERSSKERSSKERPEKRERKTKERSSKERPQTRTPEKASRKRSRKESSEDSEVMADAEDKPTSKRGSRKKAAKKKPEKAAPAKKAAKKKAAKEKPAPSKKAAKATKKKGPAPRKKRRW